MNIVRIFSDGDYIFAHTEYDFNNSNIGFEIFRFEGEQTVEHWDNIQPRQGPNPSSNTMVNGIAEAIDHKNTERNRKIVQIFIQDVLIKHDLNKLKEYIISDYIEHNPRLSNGLPALHVALSTPKSIQYNKNHQVLAEGNFVLSVCEGTMNEIHSSFFDLYRLDKGKIVEHWDTIEKIPPKSEWKNNNGKF